MSSLKNRHDGKPTWGGAGPRPRVPPPPISQLSTFTPTSFPCFFLQGIPRGLGPWPPWPLSGRRMWRTTTRWGKSWAGELGLVWGEGTLGSPSHCALQPPGLWKGQLLAGKWSSFLLPARSGPLISGLPGSWHPVPVPHCLLFIKFLLVAPPTLFGDFAAGPSRPAP